jgi:cytosine deaminase
MLFWNKLCKQEQCLRGIPAFDHDPLLHLEKMMALAKRYDVDVDAHIDETDDPTSLTLRDLARLTKEYGYEGRVTAAHCCSLAANDPEVVDAILQEVHDAQMTIVPLPSTNLYLQGRETSKIFDGGIAPIKKMVHDFTFNVAIGSDNVRDPFNCFGNAIPCKAPHRSAWRTEGGNQDFDALFAAISINGMKLMLMITL